MVIRIHSVAKRGDQMPTMGTLVFICLILSLIAAAQSWDIQYTIDENEAPDTRIGDISTDSDLRSTMTSEEYNNLVYRILSSGNEYAAYFHVKERTGELYTAKAKKIDREAIGMCELRQPCTVPLAVAVQATIGAFFRKINLDIIINDLNDNNPTFVKNSDSVVFTEGTMGTMAYFDGAVDNDVGLNSVQKYYISTPGVPFEGSLLRKVDGTTEVNVTVTGPLDRETMDVYHIRVIAEDGGDTVLTGEIDVTVTILDVNDNDPEFTQQSYNVTLNEDVTIGTVIETVTATDIDLGKNAEITYKLSESRNEDIPRWFSINNITGEITVIGQLVHRSNEELRLYVEASDKGSQPRVSQVVVYVNVVDSSNTPPQINVNILSGETNAQISEYANVGAVVAHIAVTDTDTGRNGKITCTATSDNFGLERLEVNDYKAVVLNSLNRELMDTHSVVINCADSGSPPMMASVEFDVTVLDENDNPPKFTQGTYFAKVEENNDVGAVVASVVANDLDIGDNAQITYSLGSTNGYDFWIDPVTGEIRANFILDRENVSQIVIEVSSEDDGRPKLTSTANVILTITDVNDNRPIIANPNYTFYVYEGVPYNTTINQISATDKDYGLNGSVVFSFASAPASSFPFVLYSDGTIKMIRGLDREVLSRYEFIIHAKDQGKPPLSSSATVTVVVMDLNDNAPVFVFPNTDNNTSIVSLSTVPDSVIITVKALDPDEGNNKAITYSILDNNLTDLFVMENNDNNGIIRLLRLPSSTEALKYELRISATDNGSPQQSTIRTLIVAFVKDGEPDDRTNFLIAVTLGCVTVVVSIAIVITICLIRRHDRLKHPDCTGCTSTIDMEVVPDDSKQSMTLSSSDSRESLKKVSFNVDSVDYNSTISSERSKDISQAPLMNQDSLYKTSDTDRRPNATSSPRGYTQPSQVYDMQKLDPNTVLQLHKTLLQSHDQLWTNHRDGHTPPVTKDILKQQEDNGSETSGESATCDSGRGGSESDIQTSYSANNSQEADHIKTVTFANKPMLHHFPMDANSWKNTNNYPSTNQAYPHKQNNQIRQTGSFNNSDNGLKLTIPPRNVHSTPSTSSHPQRPRQGFNLSPIPDTPSVGLGTSYDDDDDTTTSGSYTIDQEEWTHEPQNQSRNYFLSQNEAYC